MFLHKSWSWISSIQDFYSLLGTKSHRATNKLIQSGSICIQYLFTWNLFLIKQTHCWEINFLSGDTALFYHHCLSEATSFSSYPVTHCTAVWCPQQHLWMIMLSLMNNSDQIGKHRNTVSPWFGVTRPTDVETGTSRGERRGPGSNTADINNTG